MAHRWVEALTGLVTTGALVACGGATNAPRSGPVITVAAEWNVYPIAMVTGRLVERAGCLLLRDRVVFWPHGTRWDAAARTVVRADGTRVAVGRRFEGGGGVYDTATDFGDLLGSPSAGERVGACVERTSARGVVVATP